MKEKRLGKLILIFLGLMFIFTVVSRARDTIRTPKVKVTIPKAQTITYELEKRLVAEAKEDGTLFVQTELSEEEQGYIDSSAVVQVESAAKNVFVEDAVLRVEENEESGKREMIVTFQDNTLKDGDAVTVKARYTSRPYTCCVPESALHQNGSNGYLVYVAEEQNVILGERIIARAVEVDIEEMDSRYAALKNDSLGSEQKIIYESDKEFSEDERVRVIEEN